MRRLAISDGQSVTVYDTLDHSIGGVSQQQGGVAGVGFTSQYGNVDLRTLPLVSGVAVGASVQASNPIQEPIQVSAPAPANVPISITATTMESPQSMANPTFASAVSQTGQIAMSNEELFAMIERLAKLRDAGALTEDEFATKKTELLARI